MEMGTIRESSLTIGLCFIFILIGGGCGWTPRERSICEVQGSGLESPYRDQEVIIRGLIVADLEDIEPGGYLLLDENCPLGGDESRGIYLSLDDASDLLDVGDEVRVLGTVREKAGETRMEARAIDLEIMSLDNQSPDPIDLDDYFIPPFSFGYEKWESQLVVIPRASIFLDHENSEKIRIVPQLPVNSAVQLICVQEKGFSLEIMIDLLEDNEGLWKTGQDLENLVGLIRQGSEGYLLQLVDKPKIVDKEDYALMSDDFPGGLWIPAEEKPATPVPLTITRTHTPSPSLTVTIRPSPTMIPSPTFYPVRLLISEILPNPIGDEPGGEWIEIYNPSSERFPLDGIKLGDELSPVGKEGLLRFPNGFHIAGGQVLVIANQAGVFNSRYGFLPDFELVDSDNRVPDLLPYSSWGRNSVKLANSGDEVTLVDPWDRVLDLVVYGDTGEGGFYPPVSAPQEGHSLERYPPEVDRDQAEDWRERSSPSPGKLDHSLPTLTITPTILHFPSPTDDHLPYTSTYTPSITPVETSLSTATPGSVMTPSHTITPSLTPVPTGIPSGVPPLTSTPTPGAETSPTSIPLPTSTATEELATITPSGTASFTPALTDTATQSLTATLEATITVTIAPNVVINEIHADPDPDRGDSNGDGEISSDDDEFLELVNISDLALDLSGWQILDGVRLRFTFPDGVNLAAGCGAVIFGGGDPVGEFGGSLIFTTGSLGLNNDGDQIRLLDSEGVEIDFVSYGSEGNQNQSLNRNPDLIGPLPLVLHAGILGANEALYSPGTRVDGTGFTSCP
jgi:hypothetical protein